MSTRPGLRGGRHHALGVGRGLGQRLLHEAVLAGRRARARPARRGWARAWPPPRRPARGRPAARRRSAAARASGKAGASRATASGRAVAEPGQLGLRAGGRSCGPGSGPSSPGPRPRPAPGAGAHSRTRLGASMPRVTPRKSTTSGAVCAPPPRTSRPGCAVTITAQSASSSAASSGSDVELDARAARARGRRGRPARPPRSASVAHDLDRRRLAQVAHARLVGHAEDRDPRAAHRLGVVVQRAGDPLDAELGHALVDLARQLHELGGLAVLARLPGEVERVDRQAVAAHARARARSA